MPSFTKYWMHPRKVHQPKRCSGCCYSLLSICAHQIFHCGCSNNSLYLMVRLTVWPLHLLRLIAITHSDLSRTFCAACASSTKLTAAQAQAVIGGLCGSGHKTEPVQIISAFDTPKIRYDPIRKVFYQLPGRPSLHGTAEVCPAFTCSPSLLMAHSTTVLLTFESHQNTCWKVRWHISAIQVGQLPNGHTNTSFLPRAQR